MTDAVRSFMDKKAVAQVLEQIAAFLELKAENPFRIRAFRTAARAVGSFPGDLREGIEDGSLAATKGVGPATLQIVAEIVATGRASMLEELREQIPPGLVEMLAISGLGVAKIRQMHEVLDIDSVPELEAAALDGRLARLPRFGPKTSENILKGIAFLRQASAYRLSHHAADEAEGLRAALERLPGVLEAVVAGEVRRRTEVVRDIVIVLVADVPPAELFRRLGQLPGIHEFAGQDDRRLTLRFAGGASAQIVVTTPVNAGAVLVQATGSESHLRELAAHAASRDFSLTGAALWRGSDFVPTPDEARFYAALDLDCIPPELREGQGEVEAAAHHALPTLLERSDLRGFLHCHTRYSDGSSSVEELSLACRDAGFEYVGITDHSQAAAYAGGLKPDDLARQSDEIDEVNARLDGIRVLKGVEADILQDGRIDFDESVLARLDFVIASVHSRFNMGEREMTARMLAAMDNPYLTILGHPTGRLLLSREPYGLDIDAVIEKAAATGVALEINADPHRLDLDWRVVRRARERGAAISIGADAHNVAGIANVEFGVGTARKGWLGPDDVLNTLPVEQFLARAARRKPG
ncbi:MAG TPA: DNA polymerase/3'-5' exonuclease PolX [Gemmatimonadales bacterium]|jgi:DNA polymerase (family 10)|nr:DNA polymerase/3'-5' exonuclease PolX [Gemmatimonadales bacterium]